MRLLDENLISGLLGPSKAQEHEVGLNLASSLFVGGDPTMVKVSVLPHSPVTSPSPDADKLAADMITWTKG